jgi:subtilisin family serine protease
MPLLKRGLVLSAALVAFAFLGGAGAGVRPAGGAPVEVVVTLERPSLAAAFGTRVGGTATYTRTLADDQARLQQRIEEAIPGARIRWRYRHVLNGLAVVVPAGAVRRLHSLPGVADVYESFRYHPTLDESPGLINAPSLWGPALATAGQGVKIGIIDDGVDQAHRFFSPAGFTAPVGFPKGNTSYTTAKVIVARAFAPPNTKWKYAGRPFDPNYSEHATHVAGIAAGDYNATQRGGRPVSGVAPRAYLGNYKVLTVPTPGVGLDGNSPEIVKGIDAAVADGMDVINLSLGEPEIDVDRDIVVKALNGAADAGVVPVVAAGNDFDDFGFGSVSSPGNAAKALTAAAVTKDDEIASFSSGGPSGIDLGFKPDMSAPGVNIYSSVPSGWDSFSGTSMAAPHVAGGAALLRQRHLTWSPAQIKSALVLTGRPVWADVAHRQEVLATREGGGLIDLAAANSPLVFASPSSLSFGFLPPKASTPRNVELTDAGGGIGLWTVNVQVQRGVRGVGLTADTVVTVPGTLALRATNSGSAEGEVTGFVVLSRGPTTRRIPFWLRATAPQLGRDRRGRLSRPGTYRGNTKGRASRVACYRYPSNPSAFGIPPCLRGPEQVFRFRLRRPAANFGVAILSRGRGVRVQPRVVRAGDENRLTGYAALPLNLNPYLPTLGRLSPTAGAVRPDPGTYDIVFDTPSRRGAGRFSFRFWVGDTQPPKLRLLTRRLPRGGIIVVRVADRGSGVDPTSLHASLDGSGVAVRYRFGRAGISALRLRRGRHTLVFRASDYQEAKNMENAGPILPNTRTLRARFFVN